MAGTGCAMAGTASTMGPGAAGVAVPFTSAFPPLPPAFPNLAAPGSLLPYPAPPGYVWRRVSVGHGGGRCLQSRFSCCKHGQRCSFRVRCLCISKRKPRGAEPAKASAAAPVPADNVTDAGDTEPEDGSETKTIIEEAFWGV